MACPRWSAWPTKTSQIQSEAPTGARQIQSEAVTRTYANTSRTYADNCKMAEEEMPSIATSRPMLLSAYVRGVPALVRVVALLLTGQASSRLAMT